MNAELMSNVDRIERKRLMGLLREPAAARYQDGLNLYEFVRSDPMYFTDPSGLESKTTAKGTLEWEVKPDGQMHASFNIKFKPDPKSCGCKNVSFIQVVLENTTGGNRRYPSDPPYYSQFASPSGSRVDHLKGETDPYYGAMWDGTKWVPEPASELGVGPIGSQASTSDSPGAGDARTGNGVKVLRFETFAVCVDTGEILGGIKWGFKIADKAGAPIEITSGTAGDFTDTPSPEWQAAVDQWNKNADKNGWKKF